MAGDEECDDGDSADYNGCKNDCTEAAGWSCIEDILMLSHCTPSCGNGIRDLKDNEMCDDGNLIINDGCSNCTVDDGWFCTGGTPTTRDYCYE